MIGCSSHVTKYHVRDRANALLGNVFVSLRDFVYPPVCLTCESILESAAERICRRCWGSLQRIDRTHPVWKELQEKLKTEGIVTDFLSCYLFEKEGKLQEIVHLLKYGGKRSLGERLGREVGELMLKNPDFLSPDYLVPVPLNKLKQRERGYNQAECICRGISDVTRIPVERSLIIRRRYTQSQTELDRNRRRENVEGAFAVKMNKRVALPGNRANAEPAAIANGAVTGLSIVLVDDVFTTGATIEACARELVAHGAERVLAVSAALAS